MNIFLTVVIYFLLNYRNTTRADIEICTYSSTKNSGIEIIKDNNRANPILNPSWSGITKNISDCFLKCQSDITCQMAEFDHRTNRNGSYSCRTYNITGWIKSNCCSTYIWKFCKFEYGSTVDGRCSGKWLLTKKKLLQSENYKYFSKNVIVSNCYQCQKYCLTLDICGGFNYFEENKTCSIIESYRTADNAYVINSKSDAYLWMCAKYQRYNIPKMCSVPMGKCNGLFKKVNFTNLKNKLKEFTTRSFGICLTNCLKYSNCNSFIFSEYWSFCVLFSSIKMVCTKSMPFPINKTYSLFQWTCCMTDDLNLYLNKDINDIKLSFKYNKVKNSSCACITKPEYLQIKPFNCNAYSPLWNFSKKYPCMKTKISCHVGQCIVIYKTFHLIEEIKLAYTGYETFLLRNASNSMILNADDKLCAYYNASPITEIPSIISRSSWFAMEYSKKEQIGSKIQFIVIGNLQTKFCFCRSKAACEDEIRYEQKTEISNNFKDLPYNFMITPTGDIFEGSGWTYKYSIESSLKEDFLFIGFVGNYSDGRPLLNSLNSAKRIIYAAVKFGYVIENYTLYKAPSINIGKTKDAAALYHIIGLWKNYKGRRKRDCNIYNVVSLMLNMLTIFSVMLTFFIIIMYKFFPRHNSHCQNILSNIDNICKFSLYCDKTTKYLCSNSLKSNLISFLMTENNDIIDFNYTDFYWLSSKSEVFVKSKHKRDCITCVKAFLCFYYFTKRPLSIPMFLNFSSIKYCTNKTIILICKSESFLCRKVVIIVHLEKTVSPTIVQSLFVKFNSRRCFCKGFDLHLLSDFRNAPNIFVKYDL